MTAPDFAAVVFDLYYAVSQLPLTHVVEHRTEEFPLEQRFHVWNYNDEPGVKWRVTVERQKIRSIVRDEDVVLFQNSVINSQSLAPARPR